MYSIIILCIFVQTTYIVSLYRYIVFSTFVYAYMRIINIILILSFLVSTCMHADDHSRVRLDLKQNPGRSDYINASFVVSKDYSSVLGPFSIIGIP